MTTLGSTIATCFRTPSLITHLLDADCLHRKYRWIRKWPRKGLPKLVTVPSLVVNARRTIAEANHSNRSLELLRWTKTINVKFHYGWFSSYCQCNGFLNVHVFSELKFVNTGLTLLVVGNFRPMSCAFTFGKWWRFRLIRLILKFKFLQKV